MAKSRAPQPWRNQIVRYGDEAPDQLLAHPLNPKHHPKHQQDALAGALGEVGWIAPVIVNETTGHVIDGHARIGLAISRGEPSVPVAYVQLTEEAERLALATFDPIGALAGMDDENLARLLDGLTSADEAVSNLLRDLTPPKPKNLNPDDADLTPPAEPITRPGDLWIMGEHRLLCGDATKAEDVEWLLAGAKPSLMVTDPPYGVELDMEWRDRAGHNEMAPASRSYMKIAMGGKGISGDTRGDWSEAFALVPSVAVAYVWHATSHLIEVGQGLESIGFELRQQIIWVKTVAAMSRSAYHWKHEPCWYAVKRGSTATWRGSRDQTTLWEAASPKHIMSGSKEEKFEHPTQKPVVLYTQPIENHIAPGESLYEPFGGSGTAIVAAEQLGRVCLALEIEPRFCDVIVRRWEHVTGRKAERERQAVKKDA